MNRYLGPEFPQILLKDNVEYKQANLSVPGWFTPLTICVFLTTLMLPPAIVSSAFEPQAGQEPYSLAMSLKEMGDKIASRDIEILATEFSTEVLEKAKSGVFTQFEVQRGLPIQLLIKYFDQVGDNWQINPDVRAMVQFRPFNLLHEFTHLGRFDLVFCRNVLIYFDQETKIRVLDRIERIMEHDGYLALGAAETVVGLTDSFKPLPERRGVYVPNMASKGRATSAISPGLRLAVAAAAR